KLKFPDMDNKTFDSIVNPADARIYYISPFANAFVTRNPTVPHEQQSSKEDYEYLKRVNANEELSLLKNHHAWTLAVKDYPGISIIKSNATPSSFMDKLWGGGQKDTLGASGATAHNLAEVLRKLGYEAYVLHARRTSYVTVGGFDSKDDPRMEALRQELER